MIREIDAWRDPGGPAPGTAVTLRASDCPRFADVADSGRAPFVRHLLHAAGGDEHRLFRWRLEHKLVQAMVIEHYAPGSMPRSCGLAAFARKHRRDELRRALRREFRTGFIIKRALSDCTGENATFRAAREAYANLNGARAAKPSDERWLVQERVAIKREYRVHSYDGRVIPDLTFHRYRADANVARGTNEFVQSILDRLPAGITCRQCFAWDVARDADGRMVVIEVNIAGVHPVYRPGFQCSGHFQHEETGAWATSVLMRHIEIFHGMSFTVVDDAAEPWPAVVMYGEVLRHALS